MTLSAWLWSPQLPVGFFPDMLTRRTFGPNPPEPPFDAPLFRSSRNLPRLLAAIYKSDMWIVHNCMIELTVAEFERSLLQSEASIVHNQHIRCVTVH
jgi:hypothetical protein